MLLDLDGNGLTVDTLDTSSMFLDLDGDGYKQRMAWAGKGDGVLVFDADGDGEISRSKEIVFTEWAEGTDSDLEALKQVFDSNSDGKLDNTDAKWLQFKIMVDGQMKSLADLKITSIDLTPFGSGQNFQDGSSIAGRSTFTIDGKTGIVGDAVLAVDGNEYLIDDSDKSNPYVLKGYAKDGWLDFIETRSVSSSSGVVTETTYFDDNGDGVTDRTQTDATKTLSGGEIERTVSNFNADGSLADQTITSTSAGRNAVVTELNQNGDAYIDQKQTFKTNSDYSTETTVTEYSILGDKLMEVETTTSADKLTKVIKTRSNGTTIDFKTTDVTTVDPSNGVRTRTVSDMSADGSKVFSAEETVTSKTGRTRSVYTDADGDGVYEERVLTSMTIETDGRLVTTVSTYATNGTAADTLISKATSSTSADGLVKMTATNLDGDLTDLAEFVSTDTTLIGSNGTTTITSERRSRDGHGMGSTTTSTSADHKVVVITTDTDGDGATDSVERTSVDANGDTTTTLTILNPDGSLKTKSYTKTLKAGDSKTTYVDVDGVLDGEGEAHYDLTVTEVLAPNGSGNPVRTITTTSANGTVIGKSYTSAETNGMSRAAGEDLDGDGTIDRKVLTVVDYTGGVRTVTTTTETSTGVDQAVVEEVTSANRRTVMTTVDANGDGKIEQKTVSVLNTDGSRSLTAYDYDASGAQSGKTVTAITADKLSVTTTYDVDGNGSTDSQIEDVTVIETDGDRRRTVTEKNRDGGKISQTVTTTSANGLSTVSDIDADGDGTFERKSSDVTVFATDGKTIRTVTARNGLADTTKDDISRTVTETEASGLVTTTRFFLGEETTAKSTTVSTTAIGANGTTTQTTRVLNALTAPNNLVSETKTVATADKRSITVTADVDGDGDIDQRRTSKLEDSGATVDTFYTYAAANPSDVLSQATVTVSANGLTTTVRDIDGNGTTDSMTTRTKVLDANGIWTETIETREGDDAFRERTIVKTEANGLKVTTDWRASGIDRYMIDETMLNDDGSSVRTVNHYDDDDNPSTPGVLERWTKVTTTADQKTVTTEISDDADTGVERTIMSVVEPDGDVVVTQSGRLANDSNDFSDRFDTEAGEVRTTTSGDGTKSTVEYLETGSVPYARGKDETTLSILGSGATQTVTEFYQRQSSALVKTGKMVVSEDADGFGATTQWDTNGDGTFDLTQTSATALAANGLETTTVETKDGTDTLTRRFVTAESANGLSITTNWRIYTPDPLLDGTIAQDSTDVTVLNADGTRARTITNETSAHVAISKFVTTTSANGLSSTTKENLDGIGAVERTLSWSIIDMAGGRSVETRKMFVGETTTLLESETVTVDKADRTTTISRDADGDGKIDQKEETVTAVDGSVSMTITNYTVTGSDTFSFIKTSADGRETIQEWDFNGNGVIDQRRTTEKTTLLADGSYLTKVTDVNLEGGSSLTTRTIYTTISADGRVYETNTRYNQSHSSDRRETVTRNIDGTTTVHIEYDVGDINVGLPGPSEPGSDGESWLLLRGNVYWRDAVAQQVLAKTSADGLTTVTFANYDDDNATTVYADDLQSNGYEFKEVAQTQIDGSVIKSITEVHGGGTMTGTVAISADGRTTVLEKDGNYDGKVEHRETSFVRIDGSIRHVEEKLNTSGIVTQTVTTEVSADGRNTLVVSATGISSDGSAVGISIDFNGGLGTNDSIHGTDGNDDIDGGDGTDSINGKSGHDTLDGGAGADTLKGGDGNDTFIVDNLGDDVVEQHDEGTDTVRSSVAYTLGNYVEKLVLTSATTGTGNGGDNTITGSIGNDGILGLGGDDILYGGLGDDTMTGDAGDDRYIFGRNDGYDKVRDLKTESAQGEETTAANLGVGKDGIKDEWVSGYFYDSVGKTISKLKDAGTADTVVLDDGIKAEDLSFSWDGSKAENLYIDISGGGAGDKLYLQQQAVAAARIEFLEFDDLGKMQFDVARASGATLSGTSSNEVLFGLGGAETLNANDGNDLLYGGAGNDKLNGGNGNDRMFGRAGNDTMSGALGADQYMFGLGDGSDTVSDTGDDDTLVLEGGIKAENLSFSWGGSTGQDLTITIAGGPAGDSLVIKQQDTTAGRIEYLKLDSLSAAMLFDVARTGGATLNGTTGADLLFGLSGVDKLNGGDGDDIMYGLAGNDSLTGALGKDRYVFGRGGGYDTVRDMMSVDASAVDDPTKAAEFNVKAGGVENTWVGGYFWQTGTGGGLHKLTNGGSEDTLVLRDGIKAEDLSFSWNSTKDNLTIDISGGPAGDSLLMQQQGVAVARVEYLELDDLGKMMFNVARSVGGTVNGVEEADVDELLFGLSGAETLNGDQGNDRLYGGAGNDSLNGGKGHDTYVFETGDGVDTIFESGVYGDNDDLVFGSGIDWNELWFQQQGNSLVVSVLGTTDKVTIQDWFINPGRVVETMHSGDGKILHSSEITTLVAAMAAFQPGTSSSSSDIVLPYDSRLGNESQIGTIAYARKSAWATY